MQLVCWLLLALIFPSCLTAFRKKVKGRASVNKTSRTDNEWIFGSRKTTTTTTTLEVADCNTACDSPLLFLPAGHCGQCRYVDIAVSTADDACYEWETQTPGFGWTQCCVSLACPARLAEDPRRRVRDCPSAALFGQTFWLIAWSTISKQYDCYKIGVGKAIWKLALGEEKRNADCKRAFDSAENSRKVQIGSYAGQARDDTQAQIYQGAKEAVRLSFKMDPASTHLVGVVNADGLNVVGSTDCFSWSHRFQEVETAMAPTPRPTPGLPKNPRDSSQASSQSADGCKPDGKYVIDWKSWPEQGGCLLDGHAVNSECCEHLFSEDGAEEDADEDDAEDFSYGEDVRLISEDNQHVALPGLQLDAQRMA